MLSLLRVVAFCHMLQYNITHHIHDSGGNCFGDSSSQTGCCFRVFIVSAPAFSHGHHSHGKPLQRSNKKLLMVFLMMPMYKTDAQWLGWSLAIRLSFTAKWQLDPVFQKKADADKTKTFAEIKIIITKVMQQISRWLALRTDCWIP